MVCGKPSQPGEPGVRAAASHFLNPEKGSALQLQKRETWH
jgi:hypothetical protein